MVDQGKPPLRRIILRWSVGAGALVSLLLVGWGLWLFVIKDIKDFTKIPLDQSQFLRDVAEPIMPIKGRQKWASDSVWMGVTFMDAKHVERWAEYVITSYDPVEIPDTHEQRTVEIRDSLRLGKSYVPAYGPDEQAFLGLLQRWYRQDAEAKKLPDRLKDDDYSKLTEQQQGKFISVAIMRTLSRRNYNVWHGK
jgi:hypothetical protein